ncbi:MAG TPA: Mth938-like domain-containing protein [Burkholderiales bacterium]|nr:Mth938-like domain-containing protein [Burkholderiales bacterium]
MKLHLTRGEGRNIVTGYGEGYVAINDQRYERSIMVMPAQPVADWDAARFEDLEPAHFQALLALKPEIVLLGTGSTLRFPHPEITRALTDAAIGFEVMDTRAACRTYNVLMSEGRQVLALILL